MITLPAPHGRPLRWSEFLEERELRRDFCAHAAGALVAGDEAPARALMRGWRFAASPALCSRVLQLLRDREGSPKPRHRGALLAPVLSPPAKPETPRMVYLHREWLFESAPPMEQAEQDLAWRLDQLGFLGDEVERKERGSWRQPWSPNPAEDARAAAHWQELMSGKPWTIRDPWERMVMPSALSGFCFVLRLREFPDSRVQALSRDFREAFYYAMIGGKGGIPGWRSVAARVLETLEDPPVGGLERALDRHHRLLANTCAIHRGHGADSARALFPELRQTRDRVRALHGLSLEQSLDLHVAARLIETWSTGESDAPKSNRIIHQNRGRGRARLRALLGEPGGPDPGPLLLSCPALAARTRYAVRNFSAAWAWHGLRDGFTLNHDFSPDGRCEESFEEAPPLDDGELSCLRTWVTLTVLKGRLDHLHGWLQGEPGDRDTRWGELLSRDLPAPLTDPPQPERKHRSYKRVRAALQEQLPEILEEILPRVEAIAALPPKPNGTDFERALSVNWSPEVRRPGVQYTRYRKNAAAALPRILVLRGQP